ncbi:Uncharacterised protein [Metamycoplasma arthritidis]|uniref:ATP synthase gamma chain n=1 Tax=Metamycoplasma arthritidis (strain 158L3-1) TaxID=243272 RepID=B3PMA6_META1|nr:F0F1 ATP synthase subunit gamma [Metamycoplasma arthritidis]ACF07158.1 conserved hypothetical protein [Metamycoplasma arthritidis 158L3-1]VEU78683.1 Uncharacterised protein [Metamycoplasma arthritidis]
MYLKNLVQKQNNLNNVKMKVNNDRNILLITIAKLTKHLSYCINSSLLNKKIIASIAKKYELNNLIANEALDNAKENKFLKKIKNLFVKEKQLWIYFTEEQKYATDSYGRYERKIKANIKKADADFIAIGQRANWFCKKNDLNVLLSIQEQDKNNGDLSVALTQIVRALYNQQNYSRVFFVINTNKSYDEPFQILPLNNYNLEKLIRGAQDEDNELIDTSDFKIYPDIENFIEAQIDIFLENTIHSLVIESSFYNAKNALVVANKAINELDKTLEKLTKTIHSIRRENEVEEITMLTRKNKPVFETSNDEGAL